MGNKMVELRFQCSSATIYLSWRRTFATEAAALKSHLNVGVYGTDLPVSFWHLCVQTFTAPLNVCYIQDITRWDNTTQPHKPLMVFLFCYWLLSRWLLPRISYICHMPLITQCHQPCEVSFSSGGPQVSVLHLDLVDVPYTTAVEEWELPLSVEDDDSILWWRCGGQRDKDVVHTKEVKHIRDIKQPTFLQRVNNIMVLACDCDPYVTKPKSL